MLGIFVGSHVCGDVWVNLCSMVKRPLIVTEKLPLPSKTQALAASKLGRYIPYTVPLFLLLGRYDCEHYMLNDDFPTLRVGPLLFKNKHFMKIPAVDVDTELVLLEVAEVGDTR